MNKTKIEWCDYTRNPIKGVCKYGCTYCYARKMYQRFGWNPTIRLNTTCLDEIRKIKKPSRIFICSTHEILGEWIPNDWIETIIEYCAKHPQHKFLFLSKNPERYASFDFPSNCSLGATVTTLKDGWRIDTMRNIGGFISCEPLLEDVSEWNLRSIRWIIIGGLTPKPTHKQEWIDGILERARQYQIPVFIKDNANYHIIIKEYPQHLENQETK